MIANKIIHDSYTKSYMIHVTLQVVGKAARATFLSLMQIIYHFVIFRVIVNKYRFRLILPLYVSLSIYDVD